MASTVLPNGIIIPEKYSRDWYADLYHNWQELDNLLAGGGANDGTLTIQKNGTAVGTFSANQATDETINIEVPDVNDGTLTIQQNGTTVDTFTANSSSDKTVNIQCVDLTNNQTVGGIKTFSNAPVVNSINLDGKTVDTDANGNLVYDGNIVDTIEEQGTGYIRYSNGIQICWGTVTNNNNIATGRSRFSFPKAFTGGSVNVVATPNVPGLYAATAQVEDTLTWVLHAIGLWLSPVSYTEASMTANYIAIGTWK